MSYRPYDEEFAAGLDEIATAFYACRSSFRSVAEDTQWRPAEGSPAQRDTQQLAEHQPPYPAQTSFLISLLTYFYVSVAAEHLGALGALYSGREVLIPPPALIRCVVEHCAQVFWLLGDDKQPVEDRLARALLELLFSAEEQKKTTKRLLGTDDDGYKDAAGAYSRLKEQVCEVFGEPIEDEHGRFVLRGQTRPGPIDCVASMFARLKSDPPVADDRAVYDYVSNISHPTMYPHAEMWVKDEVDGQEKLVSRVTLVEHRNRARFAIVAYCETLSYVLSYNGWPRDRHEELVAAIDEVLPGAVSA